jgi:predicted nuclease with TOPRIM domain
LITREQLQMLRDGCKATSKLAVLLHEINNNNSINYTEIKQKLNSIQGENSQLKEEKLISTMQLNNLNSDLIELENELKLVKIENSQLKEELQSSRHNVSAVKQKLRLAELQHHVTQTKVVSIQDKLHQVNSMFSDLIHHE